MQRASCWSMRRVKEALAVHTAVGSAIAALIADGVATAPESGAADSESKEE